MRVIAGSLRSRSLQAPRGLATRPTSDRLRETLFNVLAARIQGAHFLDLYAGSGAVGIEALSRGAARVVFVERADAAVRVLRANLKSLGVEDGFRIAPAGVASYLRNVEGADFDLVILDPPYDAEDEYASSLGLLGRDASYPRSPSARDLGHPHPLLRPGAIVVAEHRRKVKLNERYGELGRTRLLEQGDAALSFYKGSY
ncbi:MAG TPA: 16S rRNA (guanine(966)-N(2))-methyltransferase RsmD [Terracidiphilus sp.]|jgi:16S rRNA (guanine(966)-N(2))-methyltransferase RsmD|nr:16S rRNA (guanine(966)-N(2))-methyltransferase RsmD [Terracidiphilus sp.]